MIENPEIRKQGESYVVLQQAGSDYHKDEPVHEAASRGEIETWLGERGVAQADVTRAMNEIVSAGRVFVEVDDGYSEAEGFPKQPA